MQFLPQSWLKDTDFWNLVQNISFSRLLLGRLITDTGDSLYSIGAMWLVWELTGEPFYTGLAGALVQVSNALRFLIGPLVDRWKLRPILLSTQLINCIGVLVIPAAAATGRLSVGLILVVMPVLHFINGFVYPAQDAALPRIVEKEQLTRANSLFSTSLRTVDTVANALAGILIPIIGAVALFVIDSLTFFIAAILFLGVTVPSTTDQDTNTDESTEATNSVESIADGYFAELREGINYIRGSDFVAILLGMLVSNFMFMAVNAVLPAFADSLGGPELYGLLMAAIGGGSVVGTASAFLVEDYSISWVAAIGAPLSGLCWLAAIAIHSVWATIALIFASTIFIGVFRVMFFSLFQSAVENEFLGRVMSIVETVSSAMMPAGALFGGAVAGMIGSVPVMYGMAVILVVLGFYFLLHPALRSLPPAAEANPVALGLRPATESADTVKNGPNTGD